MAATSVAAAPAPDASEQQPEGESADKPPHERQQRQQQQQKPPVVAHDYAKPLSLSALPPNIVSNEHVTSTGALTPGSITDVSHVPLPPKDSAHLTVAEKSPGLTRGSLQTLLAQDNMHQQLTSVATSTVSSSGGGTFSTPSSPTLSDSEWGGSAPSTRPPSRAPSRTPSVSAGHAGNKLTAAVAKLSSPKPPSTTMAPPPAPIIAQPTSPTPPPIKRAASKAASVHSQDGDKHKFNLKDLLGTGPKLSRKSSQKSNVSSKKSDYGDNKSNAGDSTTSFSAKYGVCAKVAVGKGATSVVRLAHKWDRSEEKLYAVKVRLFPCLLLLGEYEVFTPHVCRSSGRGARTRRRKSTSRNSLPNSASPLRCITSTSWRQWT